VTEPRTGHRAGRIMLVLAWGCGLLLATHFFGGWEDRREHPNRQPSSIHGDDYVEVRLHSSSSGHYRLDGRINGQPATFLLDTGATQVVIPLPLAERLQLQPGAPVQVNTANGQTTARRCRLASLQLGDILLRDVAALIVAGMEEDAILLGMSALRQLEFRQQDGVLVLRQAASTRY
jgi:aspartyl protease family protein